MTSKIYRIIYFMQTCLKYTHSQHGGCFKKWHILNIKLIPTIQQSGTIISWWIEPPCGFVYISILWIYIYLFIIYYIYIGMAIHSYHSHPKSGGSSIDLGCQLARCVSLRRAIQPDFEHLWTALVEVRDNLQNAIDKREVLLIALWGYPATLLS